MCAGLAYIPVQILIIVASVLLVALILFSFSSIIGQGARFFRFSALLAWLIPKIAFMTVRYQVARMDHSGCLHHHCLNNTGVIHGKNP